MHFVAERSRSFAQVKKRNAFLNGAKPRKAAKPKAARLDDGISLGVLPAFPTDIYFSVRMEKEPPFGKPTEMKYSVFLQKKTRVSANIVRREIRPCYAAVAQRAS